MYKKTKNAILIGFLANIFTLSSVYAALPGEAPETDGVSIRDYFKLNFNSLNDPTSLAGFVSTILPTIYTISLITLIFYIIWGAYKYMMSSGDPKAVAATKQHLTWAVAGVIIMFLAYWLYQLVNVLLFNTYGTP